jgi:alpha-tubulin suppressor-like RCC1 family protein
MRISSASVPFQLQSRIWGTCAELENGEVVCSRQDDHGCKFDRLRTGTQRIGDSLCGVSSTGDVVSLEGADCELSTAGGSLVERPTKLGYPACKLDRGSVYCRETEQSPRRQALTGVQSFGVGSNFSCALRTDGNVWCWGSNADGVLGDGSIHNSKRPVHVQLTKAARTLAVGSDHSCVSLIDDSVRCWGANGEGGIGVDKLPSPGDVPIPDSPYEYRIPQQVVGLPSSELVAIGGGATCALTRDRQLYCWGRMWQGASFRDGVVAAPTLIAGLPPVSTLFLGAPSCVVTVAGETYCWGEGCPLSEPQSGQETKPRRIDWLDPN